MESDDEQSVRSDISLGSIGSLSHVWKDNRGKLMELKEFLEWNPKNCDKLRTEPVVSKLEAEYDQLVWLWKSIELNLDEPLMLRKFMLPLSKGGIPHPILAPLESYVEEFMKTPELVERINSIEQEIDFTREEFDERVVELQIIKDSIEKIEREFRERSLPLSEESSLQKNQLEKQLKEAKKERRNVSMELERLRANKSCLEAAAWKMAKKCRKEDKTGMSHFKLAYNALGEHINKLLQSLGSKVKIRNVLEDGALHGGINPLVNGMWRAVDENIIERLYLNSVEMLIVMVNDVLIDDQKEGETYNEFFHRMLERGRALEERGIATMKSREFASITALTKGKRDVMHGYLNSERQLRLSQKENVHNGLKMDPDADR